MAQGRGLLDHLGFDEAHLMGGCMGCSSVIAFAVAHPERPLSELPLLDADEGHAQVARETLDEWIAANPYGESVNWASPMEAARIVAAPLPKRSSRRDCDVP